jgi:hypothetical protein
MGSGKKFVAGCAKRAECPKQNNKDQMARIRMSREFGEGQVA